MRKSIILFVIFIISIFLFSFDNAFASKSNSDVPSLDIQNQMQSFAGDNGANLGSPTDPRFIVARIIKVFLSLVGLLTVSYAVYGGYLYMTSGGSEERTSKARKIISYGALGSFIILMSYSFVYFAYYIMHKSTTVNPYGFHFDWGVSIDDDMSQMYNTDQLEQSTIPR